MDDLDKYKNLMRCPVCFAREIDVLMVPADGNRHYCPKCSFAGEESEVRSMYRDVQKKFHWMIRRLTLEDQRRM
jgi:hypothetical protein